MLLHLFRELRVKGLDQAIRIKRRETEPQLQMLSPACVCSVICSHLYHHLKPFSDNRCKEKMATQSEDDKLALKRLSIWFHAATTRDGTRCTLPWLPLLSNPASLTRKADYGKATPQTKNRNFHEVMVERELEYAFPFLRVQGLSHQTHQS